jgi:large subunit ribosomal protein L10
MPTARKAQVIEELVDSLGRSQLTIVADYRGLTVTDLEGLRGTLRPLDAEFKVAKNTLTTIAAERAGIDGMDDVLTGPSALVLAYGDIVPVSKAINDFARTSRILTVRGGVLANRMVTPDDIGEIASLPGRDELVGKLVNVLASPMARAVGVLSGPSRSIAYLLQARIDQQGGAGEEIAAD